MDRYAPAVPLVFDHLNQKLIRPPITPSVLERKTMALMRLLKPLEDRIGAITFEIRSGYIWTPLVPIGDYPYKVRASSAVPPR